MTDQEGRFKIVVRDNKIECVPHVRKARRLMWTCDEHDWEVTFDDRFPLEDKRFGGKAKQQRGSKVRDNAEPGRYKYTVTLFKDGEVLHQQDPELIVDR